jgi:predicted enzyme related to lactoylglutathione lyase
MGGLLVANLVKSGAVIFAKDIERVARFYEGAIPMTMMAQKDGVIRLENETVQLVIHSLPSDVASQIEIATPPTLRMQSAVKLVFAIDSLKRVRGVATGLGGGIKPASAAFNWAGFRACDGHDPEGNVIQFREGAAE